ncbi:MFS general substrate transporter [Periconia macrospinosa]|uniref:MFS general substrate transporter n=1 Tax=Periconia macrospinosa TaxID=97972 RepID=A0A2V1DU98_9PLEO|nr:MFS general substrate transporter [Periconia macrospinosa]
MEGETPISSRSWQFWAVFPGLCFASFLTAFDASVVFTALPTIVEQLNAAENYIWIINAYTLAMTVVQPLYGQIANILGRKWTMIGATILFLIGSLLCGIAKSTPVLIFGRAVQGMGGGGLSVLPGMIICDIVPLRDRQKYTGITYGAFAIGTFMGPVLGGILTDTVGWRWIFFLAIIIAGITLFLVVSFLHVKHGRDQFGWKTLKHIDVVGNLTLVTSLTAILVSLSWADATYPWSSFRVIVPLTLGLVGLGGFFALQSTKLCPFPTVPLHLFGNRTSATAYIITLLHGLVLYWGSVFLPVYFQAVKLNTAQQSGIACLASALPLVPGGIVGGFLIAKTGRYKPNQMLGCGLMIVGVGCFSMLDKSTLVFAWVFYQIIFALGAGLVLTALLPAIQAPLSEDDTATATATWGFMQSFGFIWGAAIPSAIFNNHVSMLLAENGDRALNAIIGNGQGYQHASRAFIMSLTPELQKVMIELFTTTLRFTWYLAFIFVGLAFLLACSIPEVALRKDLETRYGLEEKGVESA